MSKAIYIIISSVSLGNVEVSRASHDRS